MSRTAYILLAVLGVAAFLYWKTRNQNPSAFSDQTGGAQTSAKDSVVDALGGAVGSLFSSAVKKVTSTTPKTS